MGVWIGLGAYISGSEERSLVPQRCWWRRIKAFLERGMLLYQRTRCPLDSQGVFGRCIWKVYLGQNGSDEVPAGTCCREIDGMESILILTYLSNLRKSEIPYA